MVAEAKPNRLGRGLSALLGESAPAADAPEVKRGVREVPITFLHPSPFQPRRAFDADELNDLTSSVRDRGILQPIIVRRKPSDPNEYEIVAGERRWRAAQNAQLHEVPIIIKELDDGAALEIALIENIQRSDLNPIEEAHGYAALMDRFGHTQEQLSNLIGKSRSHIANTLRLQSLPSQVQDMLVNGQLSAGHARALITAEDPAFLADEIVRLRMTVREAEEMARQGKPDSAKKSGTPTPKDPDTRDLENNLSASLGLKVTVSDRGEKGGEVRIAYKTLEQLDDLCKRLTGMLESAY